MKNKTVITLLVLVICCALLTSCDPYVNKQPPNYENSKWVCSEPSITYYVGVKSLDDDYAITEIDGKTYYFDFGFMSTTVDGLVLVLDENGNMNHTGYAYFSGIAKYGKNKFTVKIDTETDRLFNGKYEELVFYRVS